MKSRLIAIVAAVVLVGCGESKQSASVPEAKPVAEAATPEPPTAKAPAISIHDAAKAANIEAVKQHLAAGTDVNSKAESGSTPLCFAIYGGPEIMSRTARDRRKETVELLIAKGADVNAMISTRTPLHISEK
jgi:hypothetical protein